MNVIARQKPRGGDWVDAVIDLPIGGWIAAGYTGGLVTHGAQSAPPGRLALRALPVLEGLGDWVVLAELAQSCRVAFQTRRMRDWPDFDPADGCTDGCRRIAHPKAVRLCWEPTPDRALAYPDCGDVVLDPDWWSGLPTVAGRVAILAHEVGHILGARCQGCADHYAGRALASMGLAARDAVQTFDREVMTRREAAQSLVEGVL